MVTDRSLVSVIDAMLRVIDADDAEEDYYSPIRSHLASLREFVEYVKKSEPASCLSCGRVGTPVVWSEFVPHVYICEGCNHA